MMQEGNCQLDFEEIKSSFLFYKTITSQYEDPRVLGAVRNIVPGEILNGNFMPSLLKWYKEFMTWTPSQMICNRCSTESQPCFMHASVHTGKSWQVRKTEIHACNRCGAEKVIPRHSDVLKIAETRYGRCGEWSILFGAILKSLSIESRIAYDYLDHCWNEALLEGRWVHIDSTFQYPYSLDNPHYYERNWKKQYIYIFAFSKSGFEDVTARYSDHMPVVLSRRKSLGRVGNLDMGSVSDLEYLYGKIPSLYEMRVPEGLHRGDTEGSPSGPWEE